jgi:hypothetical protein
MAPGSLLLLYLLAAAGFGYWKRRELLRLLAAVGRPAAYFALISLAGLLVAQTYLPDRSLYPYSSWTMYTDAAPSRAAWAFQAVRASGERTRLSARSAFRAAEARTITGHLYRHATRLQASRGRGAPEHARLLEETVEAFVRADARRNPRDPIIRVDLHRCLLGEGAFLEEDTEWCDPVPIWSLPSSRAADAP